MWNTTDEKLMCQHCTDTLFNILLINNTCYISVYYFIIVLLNSTLWTPNVNLGSAFPHSVQLSETEAHTSAL